MLLNMMFMSLSPDPNEPNSENSTNNFIGLAKILIEKANLTRGQTFLLIFWLCYLIFIILIAISPTVIYLFAIAFDRELSEIKPPIPLDNLLTGLYIVTGVMILYAAFYSYPEIRDRWNTKKKSNN